jgi:NADH dehydrogenase
MPRNVVIIGGGFGGLETALSLKNLLPSSVRVTLVDRSEYHSFIPSIHEVVSGAIRARDIQIPLALILGLAGIEFVHDEVLSLDVKSKKVSTSSRDLDYDYLVLGSGVENNFYDVKGAENFSHRFRSPEDAERIHADLYSLLGDRKQVCSIIIAGGGPEGAEVAGEVLDLINRRGYRHDLDSGRLTIKLIDGRDDLLPGFPVRAREFSREYLSQKGVMILTGHRIVEVRQDSLILDSGVTHDMSILMWTGGIQPTRLIRELQLPKDPNGWLKVTDRLHSPDDEYVYGVGDIISIYVNDKPISLTRLAYHALDQALIASMNINNHLLGRSQMFYSPKDKPQLVSLGREMGICKYGDRVLSGQWVVLLKKTVRARHMMTYLTRPGLSAVTSRIPGLEFRHLLRILSPL